MDQLFQSLAGEAKERGIGIIFSANDTDGAAGLKAIENAGGLAIVQEPYSPRHNGMLLTTSAIFDTDAVFQANNASNAIRNFILEQQHQVNIKKTLKATQSKKNAESKEYSQIDIEKLETNNIALTFRNEELEIAYSRLEAVNNELKRKEKQLLESGLVEGTMTNMLNTTSVNSIGANFRDITDRKKIEDALQPSEEKYKLLFYSSSLPKWIYDIETFQILDVNEPAIDHYGYNGKEFLNMTIKDIRTKEEIPELNAINKKAFHKKGIIRFGITEHRKKNGDIIKVEISGASHSF